MPELIQAEYSVVTPLFLGDANKEAKDIPAASFKGVLRFYWRALQWGRYKTKVSDETALQALHQKESEIFGSSAEQSAGQAKFNLRIQVDKLPMPKADWPKAQSDSGYLGMGLWESGRKDKGNFQPARQYISENTHFTVKLVLKPSLTEEDKQSLQDALILLGLIGGLGSRSRRAFGSLALLSLNDQSYQFDTLDAYKNAFTNLLSGYNFPDMPPPYSAFSQGSQININAEHKTNARLAHSQLGHLFREHRGQPSNLRGSKKRVFGMPYSGGVSKESNARRSSPLLMHIHPIGKVYHAVFLFFPAVFYFDRTLSDVDYRLITDFIDQFEEVAIT